MVSLFKTMVAIAFFAVLQYALLDGKQAKLVLTKQLELVSTKKVQLVSIAQDSGWAQLHSGLGPLPKVPRAIPMIVRQQVCPEKIDTLNYYGVRRSRHSFDDSSLPWHLGSLDEKWGSYVFARANGIPVPKILFCSTEGPESLKKWKAPQDNLGYVVKVMDDLSCCSRGIYVLPSGFGGPELHSGKAKMTRDDVIAALWKQTHHQKIHVEEIIKSGNGKVPWDYKFYASDGNIVRVEIMANRDNENFCVKTVDEHFNSLDTYGCFSNSYLRELHVDTDKNETCQTPTYGMRHLEYNVCSNFAKPAKWETLVEAAKRFSKMIGIMARIDLYFYNGEVSLGELTFQPHGARFHCHAKLGRDGCIDPCVEGRVWEKQNHKYNNIEGGPIPPEPLSVKGWNNLSEQEQCERVMEATAAFEKNEGR